MRTIGFFFILLFLVLCALDLPLEDIPFMRSLPEEESSYVNTHNPTLAIPVVRKTSSAEALSANLYWVKYVPFIAVGIAFLWFPRRRSR
jgi:hypothetical protein